MHIKGGAFGDGSERTSQGQGQRRRYAFNAAPVRSTWRLIRHCLPGDIVCSHKTQPGSVCVSGRAAMTLDPTGSRSANLFRAIIKTQDGKRALERNPGIPAANCAVTTAFTTTLFKVNCSRLKALIFSFLNRRPREQRQVHALLGKREPPRDRERTLYKASAFNATVAGALCFKIPRSEAITRLLFSEKLD